MIKLNGQIVTPTMFPDGTSQVWKLSLDAGVQPEIVWQFESEAELMHFSQLVNLLSATSTFTILASIPYMPYGRQDKPISNNESFAQRTFLRLLHGALNGSDIVIRTFDPHSNACLTPRVQQFLTWQTADNLINRLAESCDVVVFPDKGASERYAITGKPVVTATKVRDQETGRITHYSINEEDKSKLFLECKCLVVDDICDGGATFELLSKALSEHIGLRPDLYVSHGIFSKGLDALKPLYRKIITTDSLPTKHKDLIVYESAPPHRLLQG